MEKIIQHIEKLLAKYDYVVIPNLGGFVVQIESAIVHNHYISAPHAIIAFNPLMQHLDGLLAIELAKAENISYRQAVDNIEHFVSCIKTDISTYKIVQIGNIGKLQLDSNANIVFTPDKQPAFLPQNQGITDIYLHSKNNKQRKAKTINIKSYRGKSLKYAASIAIILGLLFISPTITDSRYNKANLTPILNTTFTRLKTDSLNSLTISKQQKDSICPTTNQITTPKFHVIIASLASLDAANAYCKELETDSFTNTHIISTAKIHKIALQSFNQFNEAVDFMEELRSSDSRFETAWVYCEE